MKNWLGLFLCLCLSQTHVHICMHKQYFRAEARGGLSGFSRPLESTGPRGQRPEKIECSGKEKEGGVLSGGVLYRDGGGGHVNNWVELGGKPKNDQEGLLSQSECESEGLFLSAR